MAHIHLQVPVFTCHHLCLFTLHLTHAPVSRYEAPCGVAPPRLLPAPQPDPPGGAGATAGAATDPHGREEEPARSVPPGAAELGGHAAGRRPEGTDERHVGGTHWGRNLEFFIPWPEGLATVIVTRPHKTSLVLFSALGQMSSGLMASLHVCHSPMYFIGSF